MKKKTRLQELTLKDNFMFGAVMMEPENCRKLLEMALGTQVGRVNVSKEKSIVYHPEYKGVRLDVYARDDNDVHYNVEMQVLRKPALGKRGRYYQSQMDMELLLTGEDYGDLPNTCVIFICDFDPFGEEKYRYTFHIRCEESDTTKLDDGRCLIFLSTHGKNEEEVPRELITFLRYVKSDLKESHEDFQDTYVEQLQESIKKIKESREMEARFMILKEMLQEEHARGKAEGKIEGKIEGRIEGKIEGEAFGKAQGRAQGKSESIIVILNRLAPLPEEIHSRILGEQNLQLLDDWLQVAIRAESIDEFINNIS